MGELAGKRGLGDEELAKDLPALGIVQPVLVHDLDRDVAPRELVVAQVDLARRTVAELADHLVFADAVRVGRIHRDGRIELGDGGHALGLGSGELGAVRDGRDPIAGEVRHTGLRHEVQAGTPRLA